MEQDPQAFSPREALRRAKVEHYLERASEYVRMARYNLARNTMDAVFQLDPENEDCKALRKEVEEKLKTIEGHANGRDPSDGGNGNAVRHGRRSGLVCVVDQDERLLMSLNDRLRRDGFETLCAGSYEEAIDILSRFSPDIILSEVNFEAGPRGFDLYLWVKTNSHLHETPFMYLTARLDRDILIAGKRFGVDDFILKPIDNEVVIASIHNCLARRRASPAP